MTRRSTMGRFIPRLADEPVPAEKPCSRCNEVKPLAGFSPDARRTDGRMARCRSCCAAVAAERRAGDPEAARERARSPKTKARRNERLRERRREDPEYAARLDALRERRRTGISTDELYARDGGICHLCGLPVEREDAEQDHVVPLAHDGPSDPANVKLAHGLCNRRKGARLAA